MKTFEIQAHCRDCCSVRLIINGELIAESDGYVPEILGGGDDVYLTIDIETGQILGWKRPTEEALQKFINDFNL